MNYAIKARRSIQVSDRIASATRRKQCPDCPDGYVWTTNGPIDSACPTCGGTAYIEISDGPHHIRATASPYDLQGEKEFPGE